jgi:two-component system sensor histidine kinase KdpD
MTVCLSSDPPFSRVLLRKASRIAGRLDSDWCRVYVQTPDERADRIDSTVQRRLVDNIQLAQSLGAEVVKLEGEDVVAAPTTFAAARGVTLAIIGQSRRSRWHRFRRGSVVDRLIGGRAGLDVLVASIFDEPEYRAAQRASRDDAEGWA